VSSSQTTISEKYAGRHHCRSTALKQIRIAETEKYPHVSFFFSGGRENAVRRGTPDHDPFAEGGDL
jgi:bisphosphoglycerate-independent phosphoglycerate mutase (AlkP superfamily)